MYKLHKSKSNPSKLQISTPSYNGSKVGPQTSREHLSRSVSGCKKFGIRPVPLSPTARLREKEKEKSQTKIKINNLNFNLVICQNKHSALNSPYSMSSLHSKMPSSLLQRTNFFKSNQTLKGLQKTSETVQQRKRVQSTNRFDFAPIKVLSKGQYGNLYLAYVKQLNFLVVLKSFHREKLTLQFMIDEFKIQLYCRHPNILPAYGFFFGKTEVYLIMEVGEYNLYKVIKQCGSLSEPKAATCIHQVLKGLSYLHLNGVIHRDIKPENIIVCGGVLKISDFGWSVITKSDRQTFCGTLDYVSPEVCSGKAYDNKIDCWSIGVLAYEMLTGFPPYEQLKGTRDRPALNFKQKLKFPPGISKLAQDFVRKMLTIDPAERMSAVEALRDPWITNLSEEIRQASVRGSQYL